MRGLPNSLQGMLTVQDKTLFAPTLTAEFWKDLSEILVSFLGTLVIKNQANNSWRTVIGEESISNTHCHELASYCWLYHGRQSKINIQKANGHADLETKHMYSWVIVLRDPERKHGCAPRKANCIYSFYTAVNQTKTAFTTENSPIYQNGDYQADSLPATQQFILLATGWQCWSTAMSQTLSRRQSYSPTHQMESKLGLLDQLKIQISHILTSCQFTSLKIIIKPN